MKSDPLPSCVLYWGYQDYYDSGDLLALSACITEVHREPRKTRTSPTNFPNEPACYL